MDQLNSLIDSINAFAWGPPMLGMLGFTGVLLTLGLAFMPWRKLVYGFRLLFDRSAPDGDGEVKPFNALMTALSATVGTGNIAGVATAIALGGPGAIFYMWLIALFGMATKYAEAVCAVQYREVDKSGKYVGGPMYYLRNGVGAFAPELGKWLGLAFAVFGAVAAFGIGNAVQVNSMAAALGQSFSVPTWVTGLVVAVLVGVVVIGGIRRIGEVAGKLVPAMVVLYFGAALVIILINIVDVPAAFGLIFTHAFTPALRRRAASREQRSRQPSASASRAACSPTSPVWARRPSRTRRRRPTVPSAKESSRCWGRSSTPSWCAR